MSQENVEIGRALFELWNAADMDAFRELYDPDAIVRTVEDWPEPGPYVGREAARERSSARSSSGLTRRPSKRCESRTDGRGWFRTTDLSRVKRALSH